LAVTLETFDKELLNEIQWKFPLVSKPYHELAKKFDVPVDKIMERLIHLKSQGILRQLSAIFDTRKLGYKSSLVAVKIASDKLEAVAKQINRHPGVSHNYERNLKFKNRSRQANKITWNRINSNASNHPNVQNWCKIRHK
jgi:DNA-binding Lrp family transcriptional regulator